MVPELVEPQRIGPSRCFAALVKNAALTVAAYSWPRLSSRTTVRQFSELEPGREAALQLDAVIPQYPRSKYHIGIAPATFFVSLLVVAKLRVIDVAQRVKIPVIGQLNATKTLAGHWRAAVK